MYPLARATQGKTADWCFYASTEASGAQDRSVRDPGAHYFVVLCKPLSMVSTHGYVNAVRMISEMASTGIILESELGFVLFCFEEPLVSVA